MSAHIISCTAGALLATAFLVSRAKRKAKESIDSPRRCYDVLVVGASNIDLITYCQRCPKPGETIHGDTFQQGFGGKGANQAVMAAKLGARTEIVTCLGNDGFGDATIANFSKNGITGRGVLRSPGSEPSGVAPIWVDSAGENRILIVNGANDSLLPKHVKDGSTAAGRMVQQSKVLICQLEIRKETTLAALRNANKSGCITILNPAPAVERLSDEFYKYSDIVAPNQTEAEILTGCNCDTRKGALKAAEMLLSYGAKCVLMTLGADGCIIALGKGEISLVSAPKIDKSKVVDTSGAGDCFLGSFAYRLTHGVSNKEELMSMTKLKEAASFACRAATISVQGKGTQSSYPSAADLS